MELLQLVVGIEGVIDAWVADESDRDLTLFVQTERLGDSVEADLRMSILSQLYVADRSRGGLGYIVETTRLSYAEWLVKNNKVNRVGNGDGSDDYCEHWQMLGTCQVPCAGCRHACSTHVLMPNGDVRCLDGNGCGCDGFASYYYDGEDDDVDAVYAQEGPAVTEKSRFDMIVEEMTTEVEVIGAPPKQDPSYAYKVQAGYACNGCGKVMDNVVVAPPEGASVICDKCIAALRAVTPKQDTLTFSIPTVKTIRVRDAFYIDVNETPPVDKPAGGLERLPPREVVYEEMKRKAREYSKSFFMTWQSDNVEAAVLTRELTRVIEAMRLALGLRNFIEYANDAVWTNQLAVADGKLPPDTDCYQRSGRTVRGVVTALAYCRMANPVVEKIVVVGGTIAAAKDAAEKAVGFARKLAMRLDAYTTTDVEGRAWRNSGAYLHLDHTVIGP